MRGAYRAAAEAAAVLVGGGQTVRQVVRKVMNDVLKEVMEKLMNLVTVEAISWETLRRNEEKNRDGGKRWKAFIAINL